MKVLRELKSKKILKSVFKDSLKKKVFLILFGIFFSTLAFAAAPGKTWKDARIPSGIAVSAGCTAFQGASSLWRDRTEDPLDVIISEDGHTIFTVNQAMQDNLDLSMNKLRVANQLKTTKTAERAAGTGTADCDDIDGFHPGGYAGETINNDSYFDINISRDGKIFIFLTGSLEVVRFDLTVPYDFKTATFTSEGPAADTQNQSLSFSRDGMTMFSLQATDDTPVITTFSLPSPFDITSRTEISSVNLTSRGYSLRDGLVENFQDIEFNRNGSEMFILSRSSTELNHQILQFSLGKNYDPTTATYLGAYTLDFTQDPGHRGDGLARPFGFAFSSDGMNLYYVQKKEQGGVDRITHIELECSFGIARCSSDPTASIGSQVELAKQNIALNISSIFYRFEWIKRNRDEENFTSHNININYPNPLLKSLAMSLEPAAKKKIATFVSTKKKDQEKSKWSSWSLADLSLSHFDKLGFENAKNIRNEGITFGADRKFSDNKFFGWAIRYGNGRSNIVNTKQNIHMDSLTLNLYGIMPKDKENYLNAVLGLSALKIDSLYLGKKSGQRYGKQLFTAVDFRTKNSYGKLNLTPTTKFTFGITRLGEYTDFLSDAIGSDSQNIRYDKDTFTTGQISSGFLFEADQITINDKTLQPMGGMEIYYDLSRDINYNYSLVGSNQVNTDTIEGAYHRANLRTSLGFELIYPDGLTISPLYEKRFALKGSTLNDVLLSKGITERFIIKISRSKEIDGNNFALDFDPLNQNYANISFNKNLGNLNLKLNSNYSLFSKIPDYGANLEISGTF